MLEMDTPDFAEEARAMHGALAAAYRRGCADTIARLMAGAAVHTTPPVHPAPAPVTRMYYPPRGWNETEDDLLRSEWGKSPPDDIGAALNRTGDAIRLRATKLGLPRLPRLMFHQGAK
jgi:hypothetical protein